jgi:cbb3-type cytochrome oxidase maturation protein
MAPLMLWILYAALGIGVFSVLFLWAVRSGQFRHQERARYLPLENPPEREE